jgi:hypothetical protein
MVISTVNFSEKALIERSFELRAELENAASDVSSLFSKIGSYYLEIKLVLSIIHQN